MRRSDTRLLVIWVVLIASAVGQSRSPQAPAIAGGFLQWLRADSLPSTGARSHRAPFNPGLLERPVFPGLVRAAGMIFSATVRRIERHPATAGDAVETVAIRLHVDQSIRGVTPGEDITISQWIGLWSSGQRYLIGERVVLFLYPRSKLGLTSCVGGTLGRFNIDTWGRVMLSAQHLTAFHKDPVLGGKSRVTFGDFTLAVRHAGEEE